MKRHALLLCLGFVLAGCATYQPLPLDVHARATDNPADIKIDPSTMPTPALRNHPFDPRHGLDMTDVAILAVANNPQLKLARDERGIAHAQAFAAGLLPDPVLDLARGTPTAGPAETSSFDLGLSYDVEALLTHPLAKRAANASARAVDLNLLWMEWQVVAQARQLFVHVVYQAKMLAVLQEETAVLARNHAQLVGAHATGDVALTAVAADLAKLQTVENHQQGMQRQLLKTRQALNALLGVSPKTKLHLVGSATIPALSGADVARDLANLPRRRPDLLALQAGYRNQDARYRQAILQQFPAIDIGFSRARDADGIYTRGFQVSLTLPLFNRNRGNIAVEKATRKKLHDAYTARLAQARAGVERILQDQSLLTRQRAQLSQAETSATQAMEQVQAAVLPGDISDATRIQLRANAFARRLDLLALDETILEQQAALQTLLGGKPPVKLVIKPGAQSSSTHD